MKTKRNKKYDYSGLFKEGDVVKFKRASKQGSEQYMIILREPDSVERLCDPDGGYRGFWYLLNLPEKDAEQHLWHELSLVKVSNWIEKARAVLGITQDELARRTEIARPQLSRYESGQWPGRDNLLKIAQALKISLDDVLGHDGGRQKHN